MFANLPTWTAERVEQLKAHFAAGLSCREIAVEIGVTRNAVIGKLSRLGLTREKQQRRAAPEKAREGTPRAPGAAAAIRHAARGL